jgi:hypothetical protein
MRPSAERRIRGCWFRVTGILGMGRSGDLCAFSSGRRWRPRDGVPVLSALPRSRFSRLLSVADYQFPSQISAVYGEARRSCTPGAR